MANQNLMTVFIALTAVAVLIQTAILAGFYFLSMKLSRQADKAMDATRNFVGPLHAVADNLLDVSSSIADSSPPWTKPAGFKNSSLPTKPTLSQPSAGRASRRCQPSNFAAGGSVIWSSAVLITGTSVSVRFVLTQPC